MRLISSEFASAEMLGQMIILSLTVMGISMITLSSAPAIFSMQESMNVNSVENSFAQFDSRANQVIFGEMPVQVLNMNLGGGSLSVEPNTTGEESYITIKTDKEIRIPMGKVTYRNGNNLISYEGGGSWSKEDKEHSTMLSPPKIDYNGAALTISEISINGTDYAEKGMVSVSFRKNSTAVVYPDAGANRTNPVYGTGGDVYVNITSEFYDSWANFVESLGYSSVIVDPSTRTASIRLSSVPDTLGKETPITNPINFRGLDPLVPMNNFRFRLVPYGNKFDWDIHASSGKKKLIYHIKGDAKNGSSVDINAGYQEDGAGYDKPAETWEGASKLVVQEQNGNLYLDADLLSTIIKLKYKSKNVGAGTDVISSNSFNSSPNGFSWPAGTSPVNYTAQYKWFFNNSNESWKSTNTTNGTVTMYVNTTDGNSNGSIYSKLDGINKNAITTWTSTNFTWANGTPASASLDFDWKVATYKNANTGSFYVMLVKPNGTSQIYPTTTFNAIANWTKLNATIPPTEFTDSGQYTLKLIAVLNTLPFGMGNLTEQVGWDNPTITLNYTVGGSSSLTEKSLYEITQHYIPRMIQDGDLSFYQGYAPGKEPAAESTMLLNYSSTKAPIYLYISQNTADVNIR